MYTRTLANGEKCDRDWLVYSKELDKVFCFCCKLFRGNHDWRHLGAWLREHETSMNHIKNMSIWYDLRMRLNSNQTIDKVVQDLIKKK